MMDITAIIIAIISSSAFTALVNGLIAMWTRKRGVAAGVRMILYDRIKWLGKSYIAKGGISTEELEDLVKMHDIYHSLGGNGFLDAIMDSVKALPIEKGAK